MNIKLNSALERAQSRAAIFVSLQQSHNQFKESSKPTKTQKFGGYLGKSIPNIDQPHGAKKSNAAEIISRSIGDNSEKGKTVIKNGLQGKAIIIENAKRQESASKSIARAEAHKRRQKKMSKKEAKKLGICDPLKLPCSKDIQILNELWNISVLKILRGCHSPAQLQSRLYLMDKVGSEIIVLESEKKYFEGLRGIITAESINCYYIAVQNNHKIEVNDSNNSNKTEAEEKVIRNTAIRIIKKESNIAITIPEERPKIRKGLISEDCNRQNLGLKSETIDGNQNKLNFAKDNRYFVLYGKSYQPFCQFQNQ